MPAAAGAAAFLDGSPLMNPNRRAALARLLLLLGLLLASVANAVPAIVKSPDDPREYVHLELPNGLAVLLISDPDTDKAAAALDVAVGSSSDPAGREGLAHFLEHMLFLGTEKYPQAGEYQEFIDRHGGSHNAYTAFENTNYFFDIDREYLEPALDRFSQFFVAPLFNAEFVDREKHAVHSEYQAGLKDDILRVYAAMRPALNPAHPLSRFNVGSLDTLADRPGGAVRDELLRFHREHYAARLMRLVVLGREPAAVLEDWVRARFSAIPDARARPERISAALFTPARLPARLNVLPVKDSRRLMLSFPIPPLKAHYRAKPADQIANLIGHEGAGSLLSALKREGWAEALGAGVGIDNRDHATFSVHVDLTVEGEQHVEDVVALIFGYLKLLRREGIERWLFEESAQLYAVRFRFAERQAPIDYVSRLAADLHDYPPEDVLRAPYRLDVYDAGLLASYLDALTPSNALLTVVGPAQAPEATEQWYGTPYSLASVGDPLLEHWREVEPDPRLALPEPNPFVPERVAVKRLIKAAPVPVLIVRRGGLELWHRQDPDYPQPRASFYFSVRSPLANDDPVHSVLTELYVRMVRDQLNEFSYPATLAGLEYELYPHVRGFTVKISGFDDKQSILLGRILDALRNPVLEEVRFELLKQELLRELDNTRKDKPYAQSMQEVSHLLIRPYWTIDQRIAALQPLALDDLRQFVPRLLGELYVVALSHGNVRPREARALGTMVRRRLVNPAEVVDVAPARVVKLRGGDDYQRNLEIEHPDASVAIYYQGADRDPRTRALFELIGQIVSAPFFHDLRTTRQLGYVVFAGSSPLLDVPGVLYVVQSPVAGVPVLEDAVDTFVGTFRGDLEALEEGAFDTHREGLITRIMKAEERLTERTNRYWTELDLGYLGFDSRERLVSALGELTRADLQGFFDQALLGDARRRLRVRSAGAGKGTDLASAGDAAQLIREPERFGEGLAYFVAGAGADGGEVEVRTGPQERPARVQGSPASTDGPITNPY
jgi:secreted Zn-dependent insulinase-like peptidase